MSEGTLRVQKWTLAKIARAMEGQLLNHHMGQGKVSGVGTDTRTLEGGELFVALIGERFDGHRFLEEAQEGGASAMVVERASAATHCEVPAIVVDDTTKALARLGRELFREARQEGMHSVAVTGSNGKTTTKEILSVLWDIDGSVWATPGNFNNHIGVPLTLCALPDDCDHLILEMGANHRGEIAELIRLAPADKRVITSIGRAHLEGFGSMAGVRKAKAEILEVASRATRAIMPVEERAALEPRAFLGYAIGFGERQDAEMQITGIDASQDNPMGMDVTLQYQGQKWSLALPLIGDHNAYNLAAALSTMVGTRIVEEEARLNQALKDLELPGGRLRQIELAGMSIIDDAYNANPASLRASLAACRRWGGEDDGLTLVIGEMKELGKGAEQEHREMGRWIGEQGWVDSVVFMGGHAEIMAESARRASRRLEIRASEDHDEVAHWIRNERPTKLFLKGSRANRLELIVEKLEQSG